MRRPLTSKDRGAGLRVATAFLLIVAWSRLAAAEPIEDLPRVVVIPGNAAPSGEVGLFDRTGRAMLRIRGLGEPTHLAPSGEGRFFVADNSNGRVLELDAEGSIHWSWVMPEGGPRPRSVTPLEGGNLLLACGQDGLAEIDPGGAIVFRAPSPIPGHPVVDALRMPDGSTLALVRDRERFLYRFAPGETVPSAVTPPIAEKISNLPRMCKWGPREKGELLLWDPDWPTVSRLAYRGGRLELLESLPVARGQSVAPDGVGGFLFAHGLEWQVSEWHDGRVEARGQLLFEPLALLPGPEPGQYFASYIRLPDGSWPQSYPKPPAEPRLDWSRFWLWVLGGLGAAFGLHGASWLLLRRRRADQDDSSSPPRPPAPAGVPPAPRWLRAASAALLAGGSGAAAWGQHLLHQHFASGWLTFSVGGALVAAIGLEAWRRFGRREGDPFWSASLAARPDLRLWPIYLAGLALVTAGSAVLYRSRARGGAYTDDVGLWAALFVVLLGMSALSARLPWRRPWGAVPPWRRLVVPLLPVLTAVVTLFYRLRDVPANIHFDFVFYSLAAWGLIRGHFASIWDPGFVPAPVIGLLPEMAGLAIAGPGELGFRLGGALFGLSGVVAVYILGRVYRDRLTGLLAALLLSGSIPFIHFSRTTANGDAATAGLWTIVFFVLAVRFGHPRWWILTGLAAGYCFYLWPGARIAVVACFAWGLVLGVRSPRAALRRWLGIPLAMASFAVWLVPLVPMWKVNSRLAMPRVEESLEVYKPNEGVHWDRVKESFGAPLARSFGWFFVMPDNSSQGTLSPGCNRVEAVLLSVGLGILLLEGFSMNVLFAGFLFGVLVALGAWAGSPPWYTRLVPTAPIAALLMARALTGALDLAGGFRRLYSVLAVGAVGAVLVVAPFANLRTYVEYENGRRGEYHLREMTAIGRRLRALGPSYHHYLVITHRPDWSADYRRQNGRFGELLPFIWGLRVSEVRTLDEYLPLPRGESAVFVVQAARAREDVATIRSVYPLARVEELKGFMNEPIASLVVVDRP